MKITVIVWHQHITFIIYFKYQFSELQFLVFNYELAKTTISLAKTILNCKRQVT